MNHVSNSLYYVALSERYELDLDVAGNGGLGQHAADLGVHEALTVATQDLVVDVDVCVTLDAARHQHHHRRHDRNANLCAPLTFA